MPATNELKDGLGEQIDAFSFIGVMCGLFAVINFVTSSLPVILHIRSMEADLMAKELCNGSMLELFHIVA